MKTEKKSKNIEKDLKNLEKLLLKKLNEMTMTKFAELSDTSKDDLSHWVNGRRKFSYKKLIEIAKKLGV